MLDEQPGPAPLDPGTATERVRARLDRFRAGDAAAVLSVTAAEEAARAVSGTPTPERVAAVAWLYQYRALATGDMADADGQLAFQLFEKIAGVLPDELPAHVAYMLTLGRTAPDDARHAVWRAVVEGEQLLEGGETSQDPVMLDRAIDLLDRAAATPEGRARPHDVLGLLGQVLRRRFAFEPERTGWLDRSVDALEKAVAALPARDLTGHIHAHNLCTAHLDRYDATGDLRDLAGADRANLVALRLVVAGDPQRPRLLTQRADILRSRTTAGDGDLLEEAAELCREAVRTLLPGNPAAPYVHAAAARVLTDWYVHSHEPGVLAEAIALTSRAVVEFPDDADRHMVMACHGRLLMLRGQLTADLADFDAAERALAAAADALPPNHSARTTYRGELADVLYERHRITGDETCLRTALGYARQAVDAAAEGDTTTPILLDTLGRVLVRWYETTGDPRDLDEGVRRLEQAEEQSPPGSRMRGIALLHLANALTQQAALIVEAAGRRRKYDDAVNLTNEALRTLPDGPDRLLALNNLGTIMRRRHAEGTDGRRGIQQIFRNVLASTSPGSQAHLLSTVNLAMSLLDDHEEAPDGDRLLGEAEVLLRKAHQDLAPGRHHHPAVARALARCRSLRATAEDRPRPDAESVALLRQVMRARDGVPPGTRMSAAVQLGGLLADAGVWTQAREAYTEGLHLLVESATPRRGRAVQEHNLGSFFGLASQAAACALAMGDPAGAVELLERGRGLLIPTTGRAAPVHRTEALDTGGRTVVVVNVSRHRCDALLVCDGTVTVVPLPGLDHATLSRQAATFLWAAQRAQDPSCPPAERYKAHQVAVPGVLSWLWHTTVRPVLEALGLTGPPAAGSAWPRIWWCPTGMMSFLPLHAAGEHGSRYDRRPGVRAGNMALDRVVSSYTPTVRTLTGAVRQPARGNSRLLVVAPQTPGTPELPQVAGEIEAIRSHYPHADVLVGPQASKERILDALLGHSWFHFSGHGVQNVEVSDSAHLLPYDYGTTGEVIGSADLSGVRVEGAELAFLSACRTAVGQLTLADEHAHTAGLLQATGFLHVVATQWTVRDGVAAAVAAAFYRLVAPRPGGTFDPGFALHTALHEVRGAHPEPYLWAPFVHFGP